MARRRVSALAWPAVLAWRTSRQHLASRAARADAHAVVERIAGLHAQLTTSAPRRLVAAPPQAGFARPDQWLGAWEPVDADEAVSAVTRRYLAAYGPANRDALARWFGMWHGIAPAGPGWDRPEPLSYPSENSCVCGFRCGSRIAPPVSGPLKRKTFRPFVISDS
jgi:hypothetical protein